MRRCDPGPVIDPGAWDAELQALLNARPVPHRREQWWTPTPIQVTARCVWARDGEQLLPGRAVAWTRGLVLVHFTRERRLQTHGAWFLPVDVRRAEVS